MEDWYKTSAKMIKMIVIAAMTQETTVFLFIVQKERIWADSFTC